MFLNCLHCMFLFQCKLMQTYILEYLKKFHTHEVNTVLLFLYNIFNIHKGQLTYLTFIKRLVV